MSLPETPIDRAATCGIVAAAEARVKIDVKAPPPLAAQGRILHYALLTASQAGEFEAETANAVSRRMGELQDEVTKGKWQELGPACASAFPETADTKVELPAGRFEAQIHCEALADFLDTALANQPDYGNELAAWSRLRRELNDAMAPGLKSRVGSSVEAQQRAKRKALAEAARLGPPVSVMGECAKRFGSSG